MIFENDEVWERYALNIVTELQAHIRQYRNYSLAETLDRFAKAKYDAAIRRIYSLSSFNAQFSLSRTGSTTIAIPDDPKTSSNAPSLPKDKPTRAHMMHLMAAQLFFFLRDIGHRHQHHDPKTDTISDLHRVQKNDDDFTWRLNTLYSMYRKVIDLKRAPHSDTLANAMGVIAYAETFEKICREELGEVKSKDLPTYYSTQTKDSITAAKSALELSYAEYVRKRDGRRGLLISVLGAVFAFVALLSLAKSEREILAHPYLVKIAEFMLTYPFHSVFAITLLYFAYSTITSIGDPKAPALFRRTLRLFHSTNRYLQALAWFVLAALSIVVSIWVWNWNI
ncbi:hypothetical protein [Azospirillum brasilense]|uniref:hypothetical protein n=1 Tax=Azospirillum brasilense TaxID=192 RepID=UPI0013B3D435|nr:hypothetical protein [Azospirillum brasilense]